MAENLCPVCGREEFPSRKPGYKADLCFRKTLPRSPDCWRLGYERLLVRLAALEKRDAQKP